MLELKNNIERITNPMIGRQELPWSIFFKTEKLYRRVLVYNPVIKVQNEIFTNTK